MVKPALTSEEWAKFPDIAGGEPEFLNEPLYHRTPHGIAAANLYGQPFGVRYEMADAISRAVDGEPLSDGDLDWMRTTVHVILSLLPPRGSDADVPTMRGNEE